MMAKVLKTKSLRYKLLIIPLTNLPAPSGLSVIPNLRMKACRDPIFSLTLWLEAKCNKRLLGYLDTYSILQKGHLNPLRVE